MAHGFELIKRIITDFSYKITKIYLMRDKVRLPYISQTFFLFLTNNSDSSQAIEYLKYWKKSGSKSIQNKRINYCHTRKSF